MSGKSNKKLRRKAQSLLIEKSKGVDPVGEFSATYKDLKKLKKQTNKYGNSKY